MRHRTVDEEARTVKGVAIGTDNGGYVYVYAKDGVYLADMAAPDEAQVLAPSLLELVTRIKRGDDVYAP